MKDEEVKLLIKYVHDRVGHAYDRTYKALAKSNTREVIEGAVAELKNHSKAPDNVNSVHFAAFKGLHLALTLTDHLKELNKTLPKSVPTHLVMEYINEAFTAGVCIGSAFHGNNAQKLYKLYEPFANAGKTGARTKDPLGQLLEKIVSDYYEKNGALPTADYVLKQLKAMGARGHKVIQEVKRNIVYWQKKSGEEQKTPIERIRERLTPIRKKYSGLAG